MSHSCKDRLLDNPGEGADPELLARLSFARDVRTALAQRLDPDDQEAVWFDTLRLDPGDEWEPKIVSSLHRCQAAILLLTPDSLESSWVLKEATVLADRKSRWPQLLIVPVFMAGTTADDVRNHRWWAPLGIQRWQGVQASCGAYKGRDAEAALQSIVAEVAGRLERLYKPRDEALANWTSEGRRVVANTTF